MTAYKKGFTLIELLIVIAILGVLAVVVLVAINPAQQLARTRDAGRISSVAQLGHALEAYGSTHSGAYPLVAGWVTGSTNVLVSTGEISVLPALVPNSLTSLCAGTGGAVANGWCYSVATAPDRFAVYSTLEATTNRTLSSGGTTCTIAQTSYVVYSSTTGRSCIVCGTEPTAAAPGTCVN